MGGQVLMENNIFNRNIKRRQNIGKLFYIILFVFSLVGLIGLSALLIQILRDGLPYLTTNLILNYVTAKNLTEICEKINYIMINTVFIVILKI